VDDALWLAVPIMLLAGVAAGFVSSAPPGAINLWLARCTLERRERTLVPFVAGVVAADTVIAALAAWGYHAASEATRGALGRWLEIGGGGVVAALGIGALRASRRPLPGAGAPPSSDGPTRPWRSAALGAAMCLSNPAFLMFWAFALQLVASLAPAPPSLWATTAFVAGASAGDTLWFAVLVAVLRRGRDAVAPQLLGRLRVALAVAFVLAGVLAVAKGAAGA
jgi:threonine/homoserine/homoserine lactone efflux protein